MDRRAIVNLVVGKIKALPRAGFMRLRGFADRHARRVVLVIGDSHTRVFEHWLFLVVFPRTRFEIAYVKGGSAIGILNYNSQSGARASFDAALSREPWDHVLVCLGEVDAAYTLWRLAEYHAIPVDGLFERAVTSYMKFLDRIRARFSMAVIAAPYPTVDHIHGSVDEVLAMRAHVHATQRQRTDLTLEFNRRIGEWCTEHGIAQLDTAAEALGPDRFVKESWKVRGRLDHHYVRGRFARWMVRTLRPVLAELSRKKDGPTVG